MIASRFFPVLFVAIASYYIILSQTGYDSVKYLSIVTAPFLVYILFRRATFNAALFLSVLFLTIFDNDTLNWTEYKIRPWYFIIIQALSCCVITMFIAKKAIRFGNPFVVISWGFFVTFSIFWFIFGNIESKLYIIKYWLFSVGLILGLMVLFNRAKISINEALHFWLLCILFSTFWGLLQFVGNIFGFSGDRLQHDWFNVSPSGFFSERTWWGQYAAVGILLSIYFFFRTRSKMYLGMLFWLFGGILVSLSRSALIPLISGIVVFSGAYLSIKSGRKKLIIYGVLIVAILILLSNVTLYNDRSLTSLFGRFEVDEIGMQGRFEALELFLYNVSINPTGYLIGNGFEWSESEASSIGTAVGAKASNLYLMIWHIFGVFGLFFAIVMTFNGLLQYIIICRRSQSRTKLLGFSLFISFLGLALVVPAHQFPSSLVILFFSLLILNKCDPIVSTRTTD